VAEILEMQPQEILSKGRKAKEVVAGSLLCCWATKELGLSFTVLTNFSFLRASPFSPLFFSFLLFRIPSAGPCVPVQSMPRVLCDERDLSALSEAGTLDETVRFGSIGCDLIL